MEDDYDSSFLTLLLITLIRATMYVVVVQSENRYYRDRKEALLIWRLEPVARWIILTDQNIPCFLSIGTSRPTGQPAANLG